jgi:hypothetical protein
MVLGGGGGGGADGAFIDFKALFQRGTRTSSSSQLAIRSPRLTAMMTDDDKK